MPSAPHVLVVTGAYTEVFSLEASMSKLRPAVSALLLAAGFATLIAQDAEQRPAFEVATIRPSTALRGGRSGWQPGGRYEAINVPGAMLVQIAYGTAQRTLL